MKKPSRKHLIKRLDEEVSRIVRKKGFCEKCSSVLKKLNTSHYYSRTLKSVRWDFYNVKCTCVGCHFWLDGHPLEHTEFVKKRLGDISFDLLVQRANRPRKWEIYELQALLKELEGK